jgi:hypothetical protein
MSGRSSPREWKRFLVAGSAPSRTRRRRIQIMFLFYFVLMLLRIALPTVHRHYRARLRREFGFLKIISPVLVVGSFLQIFIEKSFDYR